MPKQESKDFFHFAVALNEGINAMRASREKLAPLLSRMATDDVLKYKLGPVFTAGADPANLRDAIAPIGYRAVSNEQRTVIVPAASAALSIDVRKAMRGKLISPDLPLEELLPELLEMQRDVLIPGRLSDATHARYENRIAARRQELGDAGLTVDLVNVSRSDAMLTYSWNYVAFVDGLPKAHAQRFRHLRGDHNNPEPVETYQDLVVAAQFA